jgi:hypothetical protein
LKVQIEEDAQKDFRKLHRKISNDFKDTRWNMISRQETFASMESA